MSVRATKTDRRVCWTLTERGMAVGQSVSRRSCGRTPGESTSGRSTTSLYRCMM